MLTAGPDDAIIKALREGFRELGYVEGQNIHLEFRTAQGHVDRLPTLAKELLRLRADAIVATNILTIQAVRQISSTTPIVIALLDVPASGLVTDLAHPGGQITGLSAMTRELYGKRLQLLKETLPSLTRVAVLWNPETIPTPTNTAETLKAVAPTLSIDLNFVSVRTLKEFDAAFSAIKRARAQAMFVVDNALFYRHRGAVAKLASQAHLPTIYGTSVFVEEGGLMSYGVNWPDQMRQSATYVDKILKGTKPGDLPIEQPTKLELVINLKTAKALGLVIPDSVLARTDQILR
jgi:putative ABC transport system substrate-binding protein